MKSTNDKNGPTPLRAMLSKLVKYGLPLAISIGLCYVLFHDMNFSEMMEFVSSGDFTLIGIAMAVGVAGFVFRALRWRIMLQAAQVDVPVMPVIYSIVGTYAVNLVLPRFGELWRCEYISRRQDKPFATVLGSMVAERLSDTVTVLLLFVGTLLLSGSILEEYLKQNPAMYQGVVGLVKSPATYIVLVALTAAIWLFVRHNREKSWVQKVIAQVRHLMAGFNAIFHMRGAGWWLLLTVLLWGSYLVQMYLCFEAFAFTREISAEYGFVPVMVCFVLASVSMGVPSNGGIGPYQIAVCWGLLCFCPSLDKQLGYSFGSVVLFAQMLVIIVCGLISFGMIALDNRRQSSQRAVKNIS